MAERNQQFFHGTTHDIGVGNYVLPANQAGKSNWGAVGYGGQKSSEHAFATESESTAWHFAAKAGQIMRAKANRGEGPYPKRARVYEVAPNAEMQPGVYHSDHPLHDAGLGDHQEWVAPKFRTTVQHDSEPGRQATFPHINWNQFSAIKTLSDANHPDDRDIEFGHGGREPDHVDEPPKVTDNQLDLFSQRSVQSHAEHDQNELGDYHRDNLYGRL